MIQHTITCSEFLVANFGKTASMETDIHSKIALASLEQPSYH
jgi:hypothetical protein